MNAEGYCRKCNAPLGIGGDCVICAVNEHADKEAFSARFKKMLEIVGDDHELKRAVVRVHKAHTMATVVYKNVKDTEGTTTAMWLWRYINDVSMLIERLDKGED